MEARGLPSSLANCFSCLLSSPEDGGDMLLRNARLSELYKATTKTGRSLLPHTGCAPSLFGHKCASPTRPQKLKCVKSFEGKPLARVAMEMDDGQSKKGCYFGYGLKYIHGIGSLNWSRYSSPVVPPSGTSARSERPAATGRPQHTTSPSPIGHYSHICV